MKGLTDGLVLATMPDIPEEGGEISPTEEVDEHLEGVFAIPEGFGDLTGGTRIDDGMFASEQA